MSAAPPEKDLAFFDAIARRYDRVYALHGDASKRALASALAHIRGHERVLVLGVGTGRELSALLDAGHVPIGLDFSEQMLALCNRRSRPVPLVQASFWGTLPFDASAFDAAIALHGTLAHPPEERSLDELSAELSRVLSASGKVVFEVPTRAMLAFIPDTLATDDGRVMVRGREADELVHEDTVAAVTIRARLRDQAAYEHAFCTHFSVAVEPMERGEIRVVGTKR